MNIVAIFGEYKYYFYSIVKPKAGLNRVHKPSGKLQFIDGSLVVSEVKAVLTKTEDIPIEVSVK